MQDAREPKTINAAEEIQVVEPWGHPGQPTVDEVPPDLESRRREATRRQQKMTEDKTGQAE